MASTGRTAEREGRGVKSSPTCPICRKPAAARGEQAFPFCSARCRLVDLGRWLDEDYRIPDHELEPGRPGTERED
jgi:uncharacterized protein